MQFTIVYLILGILQTEFILRRSGIYPRPIVYFFVVLLWPLYLFLRG